MSMLGNMRVRWKLLLSFLFLALLLCTVGATGYFNARTIQAHLDHVLAVRLAGLSVLLEADRDLQQLLVAERSMILAEKGSAAFKKQLDDYKTNLQQASDRWNRYKALAATPAEKALLSDYEKNREKWLALTARVVALAGEGTEESRKTALQLSLGETGAAFEAMREVINQLTEIIDKAAEADGQTAAAVYARSLKWIWGLTALGFACALLFAWGLTRGIVRPIATLIGFSNAVAGGDFTAVQRTTTLTGDFGELQDNINRMVGVVVDKSFWYETLLDSIQFPVSVTDNDMRWTFINKAAETVTGKKRAEVLGKPCRNWGADICGTDRCGVTCLRRGQQTSTFTQPGLNRDFQVDTAYLKDTSGATVGHIEIVQDVTETNRLKEQAEAALKTGMTQAAGKLDGVVEIVTSASSELAAQIEESSRGSEVQAQRVSETATAMEEMNATVLEVAKNASRAADTTDTARQKAQEGAAVVDQVVREIGVVQQKAMELKTDMAELGSQAEGIGAIMNVISDIADQTNLLALNAAIEAARAGEAGRGFAVVADEVRKLAEKTMTATKEVGAAISGIQQGTKRNVANVELTVKSIESATGLANTSGSALSEIVALVDQASDQVRSIATASEEQSSASDEISKSIEEINTISTETAQAMNQAAKAVDELAGQAQVLTRLIDELRRT